jgi:hypothetical protein
LNPTRYFRFAADADCGADRGGVSEGGRRARWTRGASAARAQPGLAAAAGGWPPAAAQAAAGAQRAPAHTRPGCAADGWRGRWGDHLVVAPLAAPPPPALHPAQD